MNKLTARTVATSDAGKALHDLLGAKSEVAALISQAEDVYARLDRAQKAIEKIAGLLEMEATLLWAMLDEEEEQGWAVIREYWKQRDGREVKGGSE